MKICQYGYKNMGRIPNELRETIARNIRDCRMKKFPGRGGGKHCAEEFGVSPQQWSPWERGMRTPDELRLQQIADFFEVTVEYLRRDNTTKRVEGIGDQPYMSFYSEAGHSEMSAPSLREPDAPPVRAPEPARFAVAPARRQLRLPEQRSRTVRHLRPAPRHDLLHHQGRGRRPLRRR